MALGIQTAMNEDDGQFTPIIMYMAKAGRLYRRDRIGGANGYENSDTELPTGTKIAFDFGSIQVGWMHFAAGQAPSFAVVPLGQPMPASPSKDHRQGFKMLVHLGKSGGVRELATTAKTVLGSVDDLHGEFERAPEAQQGKIPVCEFAGTTMVQTKNVHGTQTNYRPVFRIVKWIERTADLGPRTVPPPGQMSAVHHAPSNGAGNPAHTAAPAQAAQSNPRHVGPPAAVAASGGWDAEPATPPDGKVWAGGGSSLDDEVPF